MQDRVMIGRRHSSAWGSFELLESAPHPALAGLVRRYTAYRERTAVPLRRRQLPSAEVTLIISDSEPLRVTWPRTNGSGGVFRSFVAGLHTAPAVSEHDGRQSGVGIGFSPLGAYRLLGVPMSLLAGQAMELSALLGPVATRVGAQVVIAPSAAERFAVLDRLLTQRIDSGPTPSPEVAWAWLRLCRTDGQVAIAELADETGWSRRHLAVRFREQAGLAPKAMARVLRMQRAMDLLEHPGHRLADVAQQAGFCDQAHLNREMKALGGCTPVEWRAARLPGGAGTAA